jgi:hypothetical protein
MAETELKVTQDLEQPFTIAIFPYTDSLWLVPFSSNLSLDRKHKGIYCLAVNSNSVAYIQGRGGMSGYTARKFIIRSWPLKI